MVNSTLLEILQVLEFREWAEVKEQLSNERQSRALNLMLYIEPYRGDWDNDALAKARAYTALYPKRKYDDQRMREDMSMLSHMVRNYLTDSELKSQTGMYSLGTLAALRKRGAWAIYHKQINKLESQLAEGIRDEQYYLRQNFLAQEKEQYLNLAGPRVAGDSLQKRMTNLDNYYILGKLKLYCEQLNRTQVLQADYQPQLMAETMALLQTNSTLLEEPQILIYFHVTKMLGNKDDATHYYTLKEKMPSYQQHFDQAEMRNLYRYLQNYCIYHINKGNTEYFKELLDIYKRLLASKLIVTGGEIDHTDYKNIVTTGLRLKEYKWTIAFIEDYHTLIAEELRDGAYLYNKANYFYESGQLAKASELLVQQNFSDIFYNMSARHLLLKIFFDQDEFEALDYQIESFRIYLMRNKIISASNKSSNINFLKVMRRLSVAKRDKEFVAREISSKRKATIEKAIGRYEPLANKNWLTEKAEVL